METRERNDIFRVMGEDAAIGQTDIRSRRFFLPQRIVWMQGDVKNSEVLLEERELQISGFAGMSVNKTILAFWCTIFIEKGSA